MLKRLKLNFIIASLMLGLMFGSAHGAKAQVVCPGVPFDTGWLELTVLTTADFTAGLLGTIESFNGSNVGGIDWLYNDGAFFNTEISGSQLVTWWSQAGGRNTSLQVTNTNPVSAVNVHVQIFGPDCIEIVDFCDTFTPDDTHVYDLGNLVSNRLPVQDIPEVLLQGTEGFITVTAVDACRSPNAAIAFDALVGNVRIINSALDTDYGTNVYARLSTGAGQGTVLNGITSGYLSPIPVANLLSQSFSIVGGGATAGADLVLISFDDIYGPPYTPAGNFLTNYTPGIFDDVENFLSCGSFSNCFVRVGVDNVVVNSDDFVGPTVTPTPPITCFDDEQCPPGTFCTGNLGECSESGDPCEINEDCGTDGGVCEGAEEGTCELIPTSPSPTPPPPGRRSSGCAVAGPVGIGTAVANVLIPLVPVAFAFGVSALRRRNRKNQ